MARLFIFTASQLRHKFAANVLWESHDIVGLVSEQKPDFHKKQVDEIHPLVVQHFEERERKEEFYFGIENIRFRAAEEQVRILPYKGSNSLEVFEWVKQCHPDFIILFGSSIIRDPLLTYFKDRIINLHLGLSPYYRGSGTNFWPLVNKEPQCVGATIHYATEEIDGGDIIIQVRPDVSATDRCHDFGCKTIIKAIEEINRLLPHLLRGEKKAVRQQKNGRVYKAKDFNVEAIAKMFENFEAGMVEDYVKNKNAFDAEFPIVTWR